MNPQPMFDPACLLRLQDLPVPGGRLHFGAAEGELVLLQGGSAHARLRVLSVCAGHAFGGPGRCLIDGQDTRALDGPALAALRARRTARVLRFDALQRGVSLLSATAALALARGVPAPLALRRASDELAQVGLGRHLTAGATELPAAQQRLALVARAKACRPALMVVEDADEGLDAGERALMRQALAGAAERGSCVIYSARHPGLAQVARRHLHIGSEQLEAA